jgi:hypothetical protein
MVMAQWQQWCNCLVASLYLTPSCSSSYCSQNSCRLRSVTWSCAWGRMFHPSHPHGPVVLSSSFFSKLALYFYFSATQCFISFLPAYCCLSGSLSSLVAIFVLLHVHWTFLLIHKFHKSSVENNFINGRWENTILVGQPEGKRPLGKLGRRWEDNIKMDLREVGLEGVDWIGLAQNMHQWRALVNTIMNPGVSWKAGNFLTNSFSNDCAR